MPLSPDLRATEVGREIGGLLLSVVQHAEPMLFLRAIHWRNALARVGISLPLFAVHDLGATGVLDPGSLNLAPRPRALDTDGAPARGTLEAWAGVVESVARTETMAHARAARLPDDLLTVVLMRALSMTSTTTRDRSAALLPFDAALFEGLEPELPAFYVAHDRQRERDALGRLVSDRHRLLLGLEQIDLDTLRLLGLFGNDAVAARSEALFDILAVLGSPEANDVVAFSLDLLPSLLETKRSTGEQRFSVDGYAGLARRGTLDSLVLSELAFDPELFEQRFVEGEVLYYAREKEATAERRLHYVVVDATASMRGLRATFARGLALGLVKKLGLLGDEVWLRFFDSRLHEPFRARARGGGSRGARDFGAEIPAILAFRGERGRNYARVFSDLAVELERLARRERRSPTLYVVTHAECHIPRDVIERVRAVAKIYGVFMLPSQGTLDLDYLDRLATVQVVDEHALRERSARAARALDIVEDAARAGRRAPGA